MKVEDILRYDRVVKDIIDNAKLDSVLKFKFLQMAKQFEPVIENVNKVRDEVLNKYSSTNENGQSGIFQPDREKFESDEAFNDAVKEFQEKITKFNEELQPVFEEEVKIELKKFKASDVMNSGIPAESLLVIYDLIEE